MAQGSCGASRIDHESYMPRPFIEGDSPLATSNWVPVEGRGCLIEVGSRVFAMEIILAPQLNESAGYTRPMRDS